MKRALILTALAGVISFLALAPPLKAAEALVGIWRLEHQEVNGQQGETDPLGLKVAQSGDTFSFAFSVLINEIYVVTLTYTVRLDGSTADIKTGSGEKIGTIQMMRSGANRYSFTMKGPNRPESRGELTVSADGQTLISESNATQSGSSIHSKQTFSRYQ
jgi:hypothetical protein